jgi:hypothetical protein
MLLVFPKTLISQLGVGQASAILVANFGRVFGIYADEGAAMVKLALAEFDEVVRVLWALVDIQVDGDIA